MPEFQIHDFLSKQKPQFRIFIKCNYVLINSYSASGAANILSIRFRPNHSRPGKWLLWQGITRPAFYGAPSLRLAILK